MEKSGKGEFAAGRGTEAGRHESLRSLTQLGPARAGQAGGGAAFRVLGDSLGSHAVRQPMYLVPGAEGKSWGSLGVRYGAIIFSVSYHESLSPPEISKSND